jgi:hypothetical protein
LENAAKKLERFFLLFLFINPFLDILGGLYLSLADRFGLPAVTPSLVARMGVLALFALYVVLRRNLKAVLVMIPLAVAWVLSLAGEIMYYYAIDLYADAQYIVRFAFNIAVILVYALVFRHSAMNRKALFSLLNRALTFAAALLGGVIVLSYAFGVGYSTYSDRFGSRGVQGFFYSGNDITAVLMLLLPLCFGVLFQLPRKEKQGKLAVYTLAPAVALVALLLIGTKTAYLAIAGSAVVMLAYAIFVAVRQKNRVCLARFGLVCAAFAVIFGGLMLLSQASLAGDIRRSLTMTGTIADESGIAGAILSGRNHKLAKAWAMARETTPYALLFGVGRGTQPNVIEMDIFEVLLYYGLFGGIVMLWLYVKLGVGFVAKALKRFDLTGLALLVSLGLGAGYLVMAGHVLFSVTSGFYFALILVYAQLYYAPSLKKFRVV